MTPWPRIERGAAGAQASSAGYRQCGGGVGGMEQRERLQTPGVVCFARVQFTVCKSHLPEADQQQMKVDQNLGL